MDEMAQGEETGFLEHTDETIRTAGFLDLLRYCLRRWGFAGTAARYLLMHAETKQFISSGCGGFDKSALRGLLADFNRIQKNVHCAHAPYQFVVMAKHFLELKTPGPIVECGCFKGGGSAKLSLLAKLMGRELIICDSFMGLPQPEDSAEERLEGYGNSPSYQLSAGQYAGTLDEVKTNIGTYGCLDVCTFVQGYYQDSLKSLTIQPACVVLDVDLVSSARDCLKYLWPQTMAGGLWFTHEACYLNYLYGTFDERWWQEHLGQAPPVVFGAGCGLSECATAIAYFVKNSSG